ncbi:hypothetical protein EVAR_33575_1 [Eumeta japonica]|uniref:Uncharacterized protein n=1 Tax=Eumeta variegata TaxID=151549 RepID=A0A4C1VLU3_EUMVA|nr:hypothetical protein EVAR_33575_1 [Eumeta japonica]
MSCATLLKSDRAQWLAKGREEIAKSRIELALARVETAEVEEFEEDEDRTSEVRSEVIHQCVVSWLQNQDEEKATANGPELTNPAVYKKDAFKRLGTLHIPTTTQRIENKEQSKKVNVSELASAIVFVEAFTAHSMEPIKTLKYRVGEKFFRISYAARTHARTHGLMMELPNVQLCDHILKANHGQSVFHDNMNKSKHGWVTLSHYGVLASTFRLHHQTL